MTTAAGPVVRTAVADDRHAAGAVARAAFGAADPEHGDVVVRLIDLLHTSGHARAELVADVDGDVAGHVLLSHSWVDAAERLVDVLVLSPLSVRPDRQGTGLGTALVAAAVETARDLGAPALFLEGDPGFYGPRGFEPGSAHGFAAPSVRIPDPGFQVVVLPAHEPWMRGALVYCEPFWALDCVGLRPR